MKKIYILTYHCCMNSGAMLQCYALEKAIKKRGYQVQVIDYRPEKIRSDLIESFENERCWEKILRPIKDGIRLCGRKIKYANKSDKGFFVYSGTTEYSFYQFLNKKIKKTKDTFYTEEELLHFGEEDAIFITGSDQVWNPALSGTPNAYFLDFVKQGTKNSYAASLGVDTVNAQLQHLLNKLNDFNIISVREKSGVDIINSCLTGDVNVVTDPVFLLRTDEWKKLTSMASIKEPYVFLYRMESNKEFVRQVEIIRETYPNIKIAKFDFIQDEVQADYNIPIKGPKEFVKYIFGSTIVLTNSFHGTAFSIIAQKPARVIPHSTLNTRIESLMEMIHCPLIDGIYKTDENDYHLMQSYIANSEWILEEICKDAK